MASWTRTEPHFSIEISTELCFRVALGLEKLSAHNTNTSAVYWKRKMLRKVTQTYDLGSLLKVGRSGCEFLLASQSCQSVTRCTFEALIHRQELWQMIVCLTPLCLPVSARTWYLVRLNSTLVCFLDGCWICSLLHCTVNRTALFVFFYLSLVTLIIRWC